ncbi:hypothetical protein IFR05_013319 [Cadophora sp. M221]|nr:hypothetical protein IFR05_013319 [Cadophora sp. M221]
MYWFVIVLIIFAGPAICDFPGTASLDVCKLNPTYLAIRSSRINNGATKNHEMDSSGSFDFAANCAEIQFLTAKSYDRRNTEINSLVFPFDQVMANLTEDLDMWLAMKGPRSQCIETANATSRSLFELKPRFERSLEWTSSTYKDAQSRLESAKKDGPDSAVSFTQKLLGVRSTSTRYQEALSELHEQLSNKQNELLKESMSSLQKLTEVEDSIENILQAATGNTRPLKREKLAEYRYWAWRLRSLKNKFYVEGFKFNWNSNMKTCAEFSRSIKEARKFVGTIYLLLLDQKKMLDNLGEELARDIDIWAVDDEQQESRVDYYLRILTEGVEILWGVGEEVKELKADMLKERFQIDAKNL